MVFPEGGDFSATSLVTNDERTWNLLGPALEWNVMTPEEKGGYGAYMGEFARQAVFKSDYVAGNSATEVLLPTRGMDVPVDIAHFGNFGRGYRLAFSEVKMGYVDYLSGTQFFGFKRLVEEGIARPRYFYLLLSPSGELGIGETALHDIRGLGFG